MNDEMLEQLVYDAFKSGYKIGRQGKRKDIKNAFNEWNNPTSNHRR